LRDALDISIHNGIDVYKYKYIASHHKHDMTWTMQHATPQHTCEKSYAQSHMFGSAANT